MNKDLLGYEGNLGLNFGSFSKRVWWIFKKKNYEG